MSHSPGRYKTIIGGSILVAAVLAALVSPWLPSPVPDEALSVASVYSPPSGKHWLGTDDAGSDLLLEIFRGTRVSLIVGLFASLISVLLGGAVGLVAGFAGGRSERVLMRLTDIVLVLPALPLAIVLVAVTEPGLRSLILVIGLVGWTGTARLVRAQTLAVKERAFVRRARAIGARETRILFHHVLPQVLPLLAANGALVVSQAILSESTLSFLGLGDPDLSSWGKMLSFALARGALSAGAWWALVGPGLAIVGLVLGATLLGFGLEERSVQHARRNHLAAGAAPLRSSLVLNPLASKVSAREPLLAVDRLTVEYEAPGSEPVRALEEVSFALETGEILGLVGESGCGKTTAMMSLIGLLPERARIVSGSIRLAGKELVGRGEAEFAEERWRSVALIYQGSMNAMNPVLTIGRQIAEGVLRAKDPAAGVAVRRRVAELLERVGIPSSRAGRYPHELSGGMRQRAVIAMALAGNPKILLADEPTTALDVIVQAQILRLLDELRRELGLAIVLVTHDLGVVAELCDRVAVMYGGTVVEVADVEQLFGRPLHPYSRALLAAFPDLERPADDLRSIPGHPPRLDPPPVGCRFTARCVEARARCSEEGPALLSVAPGRSAACHFVSGTETV